MRTAFANALIRAARADERIVLLTGDHGYSLFDEFRRVCPHQYLNAGVAEQNMVGVAAGLAKGGLRPVVYGLSSFVPIRVLEQIKLDVCYEALPVIFIGDGAGVVYSTLGSSHQSTEDIAALRALPHMSILSPADAHEMTACMNLAFGATSPVYVRMGKSDVGAVHESLPDIQWGRLCPLRIGNGQVAWIATGSMVKASLEASCHWPESSVWSAPSLKPLDADCVTKICQRHQALVVLEEHSIHGGLGAAVAEIATERSPTWVCRIGIADRFSHRCGSYQYLRTEHGLDTETIIRRVEEFLTQMSRTTSAFSIQETRQTAA